MPQPAQPSLRARPRTPLLLRGVLSACVVLGVLIPSGVAHAQQTASEEGWAASVVRGEAPAESGGQYYPAPRPRYRFGTLETHRWINSWLPQHRRVNRTTAAAVARYANAAVSNYLRALAAAQQQADLIWHWQGVANCESGDNIYAVSASGTYRGWLQFDRASWNANGGTGDPLGQSRATAARVAENYRLRSGTSPWPICGRHYR